jgi:hypothetical protein
MAITGATATPITPAFRPGRGRVIAVPEHSAQAFKVGVPAFISAGYLTVVTGNLPQTIHGFTRIAGQDGASDGAKKGSLYLAEDGATFKGTLVGTLAQANRGAKALISVDSAGSAFLTIATASSASYNAKIEGWSSEWTTDDVNPVVVFSVLSAKLQAVN